MNVLAHPIQTSISWATMVRKGSRPDDARPAASKNSPKVGSASVRARIGQAARASSMWSAAGDVKAGARMPRSRPPIASMDVADQVVLGWEVIHHDPVADSQPLGDPPEGELAQSAVERVGEVAHPVGRREAPMYCSSTVGRSAVPPPAPCFRTWSTTSPVTSSTCRVLAPAASLPTLRCRSTGTSAASATSSTSSTSTTWPLSGMTAGD